MKKICLWLMLLMLLGTVFPGAAETDQNRRVILYTYYRQVGWGDRVQIGYVDAQGGAWLLTGSDGTLQWPYTQEDQLAYLKASGDFVRVDMLSSDERFDLNSLILSAEDQGSQSHPVACDAGTEKSFAVSYDENGEAQCILLGMSGDDCFENTDPNAQALYLRLRQLFPQVTSYGGIMGPAGFHPVPVQTFCGLDGTDVLNCSVSAHLLDCEAGPIEIAMTQDDLDTLFDLVLNGQVTGKANAVFTTCGSVAYDFLDGDGNFLGSVELYEGLLVGPDGMYTISRPALP